MFEAIAHRGLHDAVPENTLAAFRRALEAGADGIELDVHATSDGALVVHHDASVAGVADDARFRGRPIAELTAREIESFDLGNGARVPTLAEVLDALRGRGRAYIEIKGRGIEQLVVDTIAASGAECAVHSFDHTAIARMRDLAPEVPRGLLQTSRVVEPAALLAGVDARDLWQQADLLDPYLVEQVHAAGRRVIAWTANTPVKWARLAAAGVDGICSDSVDQLVAWRRRG